MLSPRYSPCAQHGHAKATLPRQRVVSQLLELLVCLRLPSLRTACCAMCDWHHAGRRSLLDNDCIFSLFLRCHRVASSSTGFLFQETLRDVACSKYARQLRFARVLLLEWLRVAIPTLIRFPQAGNAFRVVHLFSHAFLACISKASGMINERSKAN